MIFGAAVHHGFGAAQQLTPLQLEIAKFICTAREGGGVADDEILALAAQGFVAANDLDIVRAHAFVETLGCADIMFPQSTPTPAPTPTPAGLFVAQLAPHVRFPPVQPTPTVPTPTPSVPPAPSVPPPRVPIPPPSVPSSAPAVAFVDTRKRDLMLMGGIAAGVLGVIALLFLLARKK